MHLVLNDYFFDFRSKCKHWKILKVKSESEVAQQCPTLWDPKDCSLPGSSSHGIFQARILEWIAISFSRRSSQPRDWTQVSHIVGQCFTIWATREVCETYWKGIKCWTLILINYVKDSSVINFHFIYSLIQYDYTLEYQDKGGKGH